MKRVRRNIALALLIGAAAVLSGVASVAVQRAGLQGENRRVKIIAHRGGAAHAPENTLAALEYAVMAGADMAEFDVRVTRDGVPVLLHDELLTRTTGQEQQINEMDSQRVGGLDAGGWFSSAFKGEGIPTLAQLLDAARGRIRLMLDLKSVVSDELLQHTVAQIRARDMQEQCVLASADLGVLRRGKELAAEMESVYIGSEMQEELWGLSYVDGYSIALDGVTPQDVKRAHAQGKPMYIWTVNGQEEALRMLTLNVDGLVTDEPGMVLELLGRR